MLKSLASLALPQRGGCTRMSSFMHEYVCIHMSLVHIVACASQCPWVKCYNLGLCIVLLHNSKQYVRAIVLCASRCYSPLSRRTLRIFRGVSQWSYLETIYRLSACSRLSYYETENNINCFQPLLCRAIPVDTCVSTDHQPVLPYNVRFNT